MTITVPGSPSTPLNDYDAVADVVSDVNDDVATHNPSRLRSILLLTNYVC